MSVTATELEDIDAVFVLDSSGSVNNTDFNLFIDALTRLINGGLFRNYFGFVMFATRVSVEIPLDLYTAADLITQLRAMERMTGATRTQWALIEALDMWTDSGIINETRTQRTILITDGNPSAGQNPCSEVRDYLNASIELQVIAIGEAANFSDPGKFFQRMVDYLNH